MQNQNLEKAATGIKRGMMTMGSGKLLDYADQFLSPDEPVQCLSVWNGQVLVVTDRQVVLSKHILRPEGEAITFSRIAGARAVREPMNAHIVLTTSGGEIKVPVNPKQSTQLAALISQQLG